MDPKRQSRLEALTGWSWDPLAEAWEEALARLEQYVEREGRAEIRRRLYDYERELRVNFQLARARARWRNKLGRETGESPQL